MKKSTIRAAGYVRMSDDKQEKSPEEQRREITALAEQQNCEFARWYVDEGISGDSHNRPSFLQMIDDAERGDFEVILAWDQDRFSRFDLLDAAEYWRRLRDQGIRIITVNQGELDFADFRSVLLATINQHGNHEFLLKLGKNVCRGHREAAESGRWVNGAAPFGYRIGPDVRLVPDPQTAPIVQQLFEDAATTPINRLARQLNARGIKPPRAKTWSYVSILSILENEAYLGTVIHGRNPCGKELLSIVVDGRVELGGGFGEGEAVLEDGSADDIGE
jgi:DNA invertase Pin-like site-specific DNA recombinase